MRATTPALAGLATVMLTVGLTAAAVVEEAPSRPAEQAVSGKLGASQLSGTEAVDEPQSPALTAAAPSTTTAAAAPKQAAAGPTAAPPLPGHRTPGGVVTGFKAGRTEWSGVSNGISIRLVMSTTSPRAGEPVTFVAEASMPGGICCNLMMEFGDGSEGAYPPRPGLGPIDCARLEPKSNSVRGEMSHVYNKAGRWNFSVTARSGSGCHVSNPPSAYGSLYGVLEIGGGSSAPTGQGPQLPQVRPASVYPYAPRVITLGATALDDDGYIDRLVVDWGDGSPPETYKNPHPCKRTPSGWPGGTYTILPLWMGVGPVTHRYGDDNPHKVTVTVVSTACDGSTEQRTSGTLTFPEQPAPPPPIESIPWPSPTNTPPPTNLPPPPPPTPYVPTPPPGFPPMPLLPPTSTPAP